MCDKEGKFIDPNIEKNCPLTFVFLETLLEKYDLQHVAFQKMMEQKMHCDPHAHNARPENNEEECHVLLTLIGQHGLAVCSSRKIQTLEERFTKWVDGGRAAVKVESGDIDDIFIVCRQGDRPLQAVHQLVLGSNTDPTLLHAGFPRSIDTNQG